jgi:hypothetical protein
MGMAGTLPGGADPAIAGGGAAVDIAGGTSGCTGGIDCDERCGAGGCATCGATTCGAATKGAAATLGAAAGDAAMFSTAPQVGHFPFRPAQSSGRLSRVPQAHCTSSIASHQ